MISFDWTINFGQVVTALAVVLSLWRLSIKLYAAAMELYHMLDKRLGHAEDTLRTHALQLTDHSLRMERYEASMFKIVSDLSKVIGRVEATNAAREARFRGDHHDGNQ